MRNVNEKSVVCQWAEHNMQLQLQLQRTECNMQHSGLNKERKGARLQP
jgi:hypothetical protein